MHSTLYLLCGHAGGASGGAQLPRVCHVCRHCTLRRTPPRRRSPTIARPILHSAGHMPIVHCCTLGRHTVITIPKLC